MLPASLARDLYGPRKGRPVDFHCHETALIGRSRAERLIDSEYVHQAKKLRIELPAENKTQYNETSSDTGSSFSGVTRKDEIFPRGVKNKLNLPSGNSAVKIKDEADAPSDETLEYNLMRLGNAVELLTRQINKSPTKFSKTVSIVQRIVTSLEKEQNRVNAATVTEAPLPENRQREVNATIESYSLKIKELRLIILEALSLSPLTAAVPQTRQQISTIVGGLIINLFEASTREEVPLARSEDLVKFLLDYANREENNDDNTSVTLKFGGHSDDSPGRSSSPSIEAVDFVDWLGTLAITPLLHTKLFTDDSFSFNAAIALLLRFLERLPCVVSYCTSCRFLPHSTDEGDAAYIVRGPKCGTHGQCLGEPDLRNNCCVLPFSVGRIGHHRDIRESNSEGKAATSLGASFKFSSSPTSPVGGENSEQDHCSALGDNASGMSNSIPPCISTNQPQTFDASEGMSDMSEDTSEDATQSPRSLKANDAAEAVAERFRAISGGVSIAEASGNRLLALKTPSQHDATVIRRGLLLDCLKTILHYGQVLWARPSVIRVFQWVYEKRDLLFVPQEALQISEWQASLRASSAKTVSRDPRVLQVGEAAVPIVDGRDERIMALSHGAAWANKATELGIR